MVEKQRRIGERHPVVMEGRDIGTVVFPEAEVKIYLDADPSERGRRPAPPESTGAPAEPVARRDGGARPARPHPRRSAADPGARRRVPGFHRAFRRTGGGGDFEAGARTDFELKGNLLSMNNLLVMKFGGTSMGSAERMRVAARFAAEQRGERRPVAIVVSAMSKITDLLLDTTAQSRGRRSGRSGRES